jgi:protein DGCR14
MAAEGGSAGAPGAGAPLPLMPPPAPRPPKRRRERVLEEGAWVAALAGIIERDFFPELGRLQEKVAWLEAVRSGDAQAIRGAQLALARRRAGGGGGALFSPGMTAPRGGGGGGATGTARAGPSPRFYGATPGTAYTDEEDWEEGAELPVPSVSLDAFLARHTSEDNASFRALLDASNARRAARAATLLGPRAPSAAPPPAAARLADGFGTTGQRSDALEFRADAAANPLMHPGAARASLPPSATELAARAPGARRAVNARATRMAPPPVAPGAETPGSSGASTPARSFGGAAGGGGGGGAPRAPPGWQAAARAAAAARYGALATPTLEPGVGASPLVTWGELEATPVRIEAEDLPPGGWTPGPAFRVADARPREAAGRALAARAAERRGARGATPTAGYAAAAAAAARGRGGATPGGATPLSAAAQRLVCSLRRGGGGGGGGDADAALRASYGGATPARGGSGWTSAAATPAHGSAGRWTPAPLE